MLQILRQLLVLLENTPWESKIMPITTVPVITGGGCRGRGEIDIKIQLCKTLPTANEQHQCLIKLDKEVAVTHSQQELFIGGAIIVIIIGVILLLRWV